MLKRSAPSSSRPRRWNGSPTWPLCIAVGLGLGLGVLFPGLAQAAPDLILSRPTERPVVFLVGNTMFFGCIWLLLQVVGLRMTRSGDVQWALIALFGSYLVGIFGLFLLMVVTAHTTAALLP